MVFDNAASAALELLWYMHLLWCAVEASLCSRPIITSLLSFKKILHEIIKPAFILRKFQTGKIDVVNTVKTQDYGVVYVLLLCISCTLFFYLNVDVILFCFMLPLFALVSVM